MVKVIELELEKPSIKGDNPVCWKCGRPALEHCYSNAGRREVFISGICEECFDKMFAEEEEETEF